MSAKRKPAKLSTAAVALAAALAAAPAGPVQSDERQLVPTIPLFEPRTYQLPVWMDHVTPLMLVEFGRQLGKSQTLADWAVNQIIEDFRAGRDTSLVTVLSNSKANGQEFALKAAEAARRWMAAQDSVDAEVGEEFPESAEFRKIKFDEMRFEIRIRWGNKTGRVLVLAANPRTARGFSGHLILDEFAFHQDAAAIWEAAEPIISSRTDYLCRIASTHNGKRTLFYQMARSGDYPVWSTRRSEAWRMGQGDREAWADFIERWRALNPDDCERWLANGGAKLLLRPKIPVRPVDVILIKSLKRKSALLPSSDPRAARQRARTITPEEAEKEATDRRAYRQNYENEPGDDGGALIGMDLICAAERNFPWFAIDEDRWSEATLQRIYRMADGVELYVGQDVGRTRDLSAVSVIHKDGQTRRMVALLEMRGIDLAEQRVEMERLITAGRGRIKRITIDFTGVGTGLCDELGKKYGALIKPVDFRTTVPLDPILAATEGRKGSTMKITERMGLQLRALFEQGHIEIIQNGQLRADLNRPGRVVTATGVGIAAERHKDDHSDRFWSLALAEEGILWGDDRGTFTAATAGEVISGGGGLYAHVGQLEWTKSTADGGRQTAETDLQPHGTAALPGVEMLAAPQRRGGGLSAVVTLLRAAGARLGILNRLKSAFRASGPDHSAFCILHSALEGGAAL